MAKDDDTLTRHPVPAGMRALSEQVVELAEVLEDRSLSLDAPATREALVAVSEVRARLDSLTLAVAAHADEVKVGADSGATSTGVWWAVATRQNRRTAAGQVKLANALESRWHRVRDALADAAMSAEQARVVVRALDDLPDDLEPGVVASAEQTLVELALVHDPDALALLGKRILSTVAPEVGEEADRKKVEADERRAQQKQRLTLSFDGHGLSHGRFTLPMFQGRMLQKILQAFAAPGHVNTTQGAGSWLAGRPSPQKMGVAFGEMIEAYPKDRAPRAGGTSASLVALYQGADLVAGVGLATLETGDLVSMGQIRRMACEAGVMPAVLGTKSHVLDLGRTARFHTEPQRIAIALRDGGCTAEGCDWPPGMCQVHHDTPWSEGGPTNVKDARMLCPCHHARVHDPNYEVTLLPNGKLRFHRRT